MQQRSLGGICICISRLTSVTSWPKQKGIQKLIRLLEGEPEDQFNAEQYMHLYT